MKSTTKCRLVLSIWALVAALFLSEILTGAPSSVMTYYLYDYNGSTTGKIVESKVKEHDEGAVYHVVYEYEVGGYRYISKKVNHSANYRSVAYQTSKRYPAGTEVTVFYDKYNPEQAILEKKTLDAWIWGQILAAVILFGALVPVYCPGAGRGILL